MTLHVVTPKRGISVVGTSMPNVKAVKTGRTTILIVSKKAA